MPYSSNFEQFLARMPESGIFLPALKGAERTDKMPAHNPSGSAAHALAWDAERERRYQAEMARRQLGYDEGDESELFPSGQSLTRLAVGAAGIAGVLIAGIALLLH